jgi:hypothetical protein
MVQTQHPAFFSPSILLLFFLVLFHYLRVCLRHKNSELAFSVTEVMHCEKQNFMNWNLDGPVPVFICPRHRAPFTSPPTTRRAKVEVFEPSVSTD